MTSEEIVKLLDELRALPHETEWLEFKVNNSHHDRIGAYLSALSNSACLHNKHNAYLIFGVEDRTHDVKGTNFKPKCEKQGTEDIENWLSRLLRPRLDFCIHEIQYHGKPIVLFVIDTPRQQPVAFSGTEWIRVGSHLVNLKDYPEKERKLWQILSNPADWSAQICSDATIDDLNTDAIMKARILYKERFPDRAVEVNSWDDITFLNKAGITKQGKITRTSIILLGKTESEHFLSPSSAKISWILKDSNNLEKDYTHFGPPLLLNVDKVLAKIRNLTYRYLPDATLFPEELSKYDNWVIREALHNCIAHQDYRLHGKIYVIEYEDEILFVNLGSFIPGSVENVIKSDAPPECYHNLFLVTAMSNLKMIETIGSGIKKMYQTQRNRFFPLPDYDLSDLDRVKVKIQGRIIDKNYTLLLRNLDIDLDTAIVLDKVQKRNPISKEEHESLKKKGLVDGRYPKLFVSAKVAAVTDQKAKFTKNKGFNDIYYMDLIVSFIKQHREASRKDIDDLLFEKLPEVMNSEQRRKKISNLLSHLSTKSGRICNSGTRRNPLWVSSE